MRLLTKILMIPTIAILFAVPPNWVDEPGDYQFVATMSTGIVLTDCMNMAGEGDMFGAFDNAGNVRGVAGQLTASFGSYKGQTYYEMTMRSNDAGDLLSFKYYDASEDVILDIVETYEFVSNDQVGNLIDPEFYTTDNTELCFVTLSFVNATSLSLDINYSSNTEIAGFQLTIEEVDLSEAQSSYFDVNFSSNTGTILAFSFSGVTIPAGSGTLLSLEFTESINDQTLEVGNVIISGSDGLAILSNGPGSVEIPPCNHADGDCDCDGNVLDECGVCNGSGPMPGYACDEIPSLFTYSSSMQQAFYYFNLVLINDIEVESNDWVGAFNEEICVGARKWDTTGFCSDNQFADESACKEAEATWTWNQCGGGICDLPVVGDDGSDYTNGYMVAGDFPTFKIYDASENSYYTAESSENLGWYNHGFLHAGSLSATISILGCTDSDYCNYDPFATEDDGSCDYLCTGCMDEFACNYSEYATINNNSCYYADENHDCDGNCEIGVDCAGVCGGTAYYDNCDTPVCSGGTTGLVANSSCTDCAGVPNGNNVEDNCDVCDDNASNDCVMDCTGNWGGTVAIDVCGACGGTAEVEGDCECDENLVMDCTGECGGSVVYDECVSESFPNGICGGDGSSCSDCAGFPNGNAVYDHCGEECIAVASSAACSNYCDDDSSNDCIQGCDGIWGSGLILDICEVCNGNGPEENYDCHGNCIATGDKLDEKGLDCEGKCGGDNAPTFQCQNTCYVCNAADCNNLDSNCNSMDISPYLLPDEFGMSKIFPNPFNPVTHIEYELTQFGLISIKIYDIQGRVVDQLIHEYQSPGHYRLNWDAINYPSGMYIVEMLMQLENNEISRDLQKILYLK